MKLFAGIDGGQSSTVAVIADEQKRILGRGISGPCDHIGQAVDSPRFARALEGAIAGALTDATLPLDSKFEAIVAGISGYEGVIHGLEPQLRSHSVSYVHDARIAHAGAFELGDGIVVIAGTGSVGYGRANGKEALVGGWGYLFGDWGSAFSTAVHTLQVLMRMEDMGETDPLTERALRFFKRPSLRAIARAFYVGEIDRPLLASFAAELLQAAETGGKREGDGPYSEAFSLSSLVEDCSRRLGFENAPVDVALCGGMFASEFYRDAAVQGIRKFAPHATVVPARHDPVTGAVLLAYKEGAGS